MAIRDPSTPPNATPWFAFLDIRVQVAVQGC